MRPSRYAPPALLGAVAVLLTYIARLVYEHTIAIVEAKGLLPRWDVASHLGAGWLDYHYLITGQIHRLLWDLWMQGYWPPMHSIYQIPFYLLRGPAMSSGLSSSLVAFVLAGITGTMLLWRQWRWASLLPVSLYLGLLISSPLLLAYASVTMTEMLGALAQLLVLLCYLRYRQRPDRATARLFAISLTALFFTKYNYFLMLAVPLVLHEWLDRTKGWGVQRKAAAFWGWTTRVLSTPAGALLGLYLAGVLAILLTGGFEFHVSGQRVSVRSIGNTGHVVLYIVILRFIYLYRRGRLDRWRTTSDDLVRAIFVWFVVPVTIWLASPYPNHIKDFFNLVINRPMGAPSVEAGAMSYVSALRTEYFYSPWVIAIALAIFVVAAIRYWRQPPLMQWLILTVVLQFGVIAVHQTRFARFLILPVVLLCLAASAEVGAWLRTTPARIVAGFLAPVVLACGVITTVRVVDEDRFRALASEHFTESAALRAALDSIRAGLGPEDRLAIIGQSNDLSPALLRWELGPPSGAPCFPFEVGGERQPSLNAASHALLAVSAGAERSPLDDTDTYRSQRQELEDRAARNEFVLRREMPIDDMSIALRLYGRESTPTSTARCR